MIKQKATVISQQDRQVWLETERQSSCSQCSAKKGCGTGLLSEHVGKRFSRIAVMTDKTLSKGQQVNVTIPEEALLSGAFQMYIVPLLLMFAVAVTVRYLGGGELIEAVAGLLGLAAGFWAVSKHLKDKNVATQINITEDLK